MDATVITLFEFIPSGLPILCIVSHTIKTTATNRKIVLSSAIKIVDLRKPYVNFNDGLRCESKTAIHEKTNVSTSHKLCPASDSKAIELEENPNITSTIMKIRLRVMPVLKALPKLVFVLCE